MNVERMGGDDGRNCFWVFFFFPTKYKTNKQKKMQEKTDDMERPNLRKPRKTHRGRLKKRRKPMQTIQKEEKSKKKKKRIRTHSNKRATEIFVFFPK